VKHTLPGTGEVDREQVDTGETVFIRRRDASAEGNRWLITYVFDRSTEKAECHLLDARDPASKPVACIALPQGVTSKEATTGTRQRRGRASSTRGHWLARWRRLSPSPSTFHKLIENNRLCKNQRG
jgi:hypothetical protein